jgi:hypothetical protein
MSDLLFHGSYIKGLTELYPFSKSHNTIKKPVVYLTPNNSYALLYIWNRSYKWVTFNVDNDGIVVFKEGFDNQLFEFYSGVSGCIYECNGNNPDIYESHINSVCNSEKPISVIGCQIIDDVYIEILRREGNGEIRVLRYNTLSNEEKQKISIDTIRAIHMQKLLTSSEKKSDDIKAEITFIKEKFPLEWKIACNNSQEEIDEMINAWKRSVGIL